MCKYAGLSSVRFDLNCALRGPVSSASTGGGSTTKSCMRERILPLRCSAVVYLVLGTILALSLPDAAFAGVVDFEAVPGVGMPSPGLAIQAQYQSTNGMTFSLLDGGSPIVVQRGNPIGPYGAFASGYSTSQNVPAPGQGVGDFYLADPHIVQGTSPSPIIVQFAPVVRGASGVILDVDGHESFSVTAFDELHNPVDMILITTSSPGAGDGLAATWSFLHPIADISSVQIELTAFAPNLPGFAVDNFAVVPICTNGSDFDDDGYCDAEDDDDDNDGVLDSEDVCPFSAPSLPVDCSGRPLRDCTLDCLVDGADIQCIVDEMLGA